MTRLSVILPCHNGECFVGPTLDSLQRQTVSDWECVVVDDGSTDASATIVASFASDDPRITLIQQLKGGVSGARNAGFAASSRDSAYLLFLDSDDCLEPSMLEEMIGHMDQHAELGMTYCAFACVDERGRRIPPGDPRILEANRYAPTRRGVRRLSPSEAETPFASIFGVWAGLMPSNTVLRRAVYALTPGWDVSLGRPGEDTDVFLHMALLSRVHYLPQTLVRYRRHAAQFTSDWMKTATQERRLYQKWATMRCATAQQQRTLQEAISFRERRLGPYLWVKYAAGHARRGAVLEAARCYLRAARQLAMSLQVVDTTSHAA
jgi:glycosyltransferase involved in cell wall biosynthesis